MIIFGSISRIAWIVRAKCSAPPSLRSSRATAVMTTCFNFIRRTASATRGGSSFSRANGFAVVTAQNPHALVQRSPAIMKVAVPWLQHSQRFGHCALSQTVCKRKSEMRALVEKKTGLDGSRTLIHGGFWVRCNAGSIFAQDMAKKVTTLQKLQKLNVLQREPPRYAVGAPGKRTAFPRALYAQKARRRASMHRPIQAR